MENEFKYLTHNASDKKWGFYLMVAGSARIEPNTTYPPKGHPTGYNFHWNNGRILHEYQVNYITEGGGIMETRNAKYNIKAGSIILLRPNMWHRYRPLKESGWVEHYIGFRGEIAEKLFSSYGLLQNTTVLKIGYHDDILRNYNEIFNEATNERPGYHQICSGLVIHLLGKIISIRKNSSFSSSPIENIIRKACVIIRQNLNNNINVSGIASELGVDYSLFRKAFKKYTGLSPMQYHMSLRLKQAAYLLNNTSLTSKEIASKLGFSSQYYFSKLFKEKMKKNPQKFREIYSDSQI